MKTSLKWLRDYVDIPWQAGELASRLTSAGLEVEGIETTGSIPEGVVTARILSRARHADSDHLSVCQVSTGAGEPLQIVCGAPNCDAGRIVPLATVGTDFGGGFVIRKSRLRGVESSGMMCSAKELGIGADHEGLLVLPEDTPLGVPLGDLYGSDTVIDWEVTPNRPDWLSHIGIAREAAACGGGELRLPEGRIEVEPGSDVRRAAEVTVEAPELCPRYIARVFTGVKVGPSPAWMVRRLEAVGLRSINNVVDITNFVMLEFGQPLHAFDLRTLAGARIVVRRAADGEEITTLDNTRLKLTRDNLLIADRDKGVALAGIMGGQNSMITDDTTTVLLEAAAFDRSNIRISSRELGKATDSSYRFERGVDPETTALASARAAALLCELAGARQLEGVIDRYAAPWRPEEIDCQVGKINGVLGIRLNAEEIAGCLRRRGIQVARMDAESLRVRTPHWRFDLHCDQDLAEEVAQIIGLDSIPEAPVQALLGGPRRDDQSYAGEEVRAQLLALGFDETMNHSLWSREACLAGTDLREEELLKVSNPISADTAYLRPTLLPGLLQVVGHNVSRNLHDLSVFEIGHVFRKDGGEPVESVQAVLAMTGRRHPERFGAEARDQVDFYSLKGRLESWFGDRGLKGCTVSAMRHPALRDGAAAAFVQKGRTLAVFGEIAPGLVRGIRLRAPLFIALVDLEALLRAKTIERRYSPLPQFPGTSRDITLVAPRELRHQDVVNAIRSMKLPMVSDVQLFDIFEDDKALGPGMRSMSYSVTFLNPERTMTDDEINQLQARIREGLTRKLKVELR